MSDARVSLYSLLYIHTHAAHSRLSLYWPGTAPGPGTGPFHPARGTGRLRARPRPARYRPVSPSPRYRTSTGRATSGPVPTLFSPPPVPDVYRPIHIRPGTGPFLPAPVPDVYRPGNIRPGTGQPPRRDHRSGTKFTAGPVPDRLPHRVRYRTATASDSRRRSVRGAVTWSPGPGPGTKLPRVGIWWGREKRGQAWRSDKHGGRTGMAVEQEWRSAADPFIRC